jgi:hypothetical protein
MLSDYEVKTSITYKKSPIETVSIGFSATGFRFLMASLKSHSESGGTNSGLSRQLHESIMKTSGLSEEDLAKIF